ncbi:MAG: gluconate 2-dehydrogenase subunit 3 family protein [Opitutaceae bacterium]|nr:gluconate 2-dehydrogenase subunit 3 family protein [Opitutaceae bacterium]
MNSPSAASPADLMNRREALQRAALLLGVAITPSILQGVLRAQTPAAGAKPQFLTAAQFATAGAVAERILPRTDTPGAIDVGVPAFIDLMAGKYMTDAERRTFTAGLAEVETKSLAAHQSAFGKLSPAQQDALLTAMAEAAQSKRGTFFHQIKELTILGYFTSEPVGRNVTHYDPIPGRYQGCIPIAEVGNRAWTRS